VNRVVGLLHRRTVASNHSNRALDGSIDIQHQVGAIGERARRLVAADTIRRFGQFIPNESGPWGADSDAGHRLRRFLFARGFCFGVPVLSRRVLNCGIDLSSDQEREPGHIEPQHQNHDRAQ
jgi:hypothetical protein